MVRADTQNVPAERQKGVAERFFDVAVRAGAALGAIALFATDYLVPELSQVGGLEGSVHDHFLSEGDYE